MKKLILLLPFLVGIFAFDMPSSISRVSSNVKATNVGASTSVTDRNRDWRLLQDQKEDLAALLELNRYAIVLTELYALFLGTVLISFTYKPSLWLEIIQFGSNVRARINGTVLLSIAKTIKHIHIYRALTSFFLV